MNRDGIKAELEETPWPNQARSIQPSLKVGEHETFGLRAAEILKLNRPDRWSYHHPLGFQSYGAG